MRASARLTRLVAGQLEQLAPQFGRMRAEALWATPTEMQVLNHRYRGKNQPTDVLSFPLYHFSEIEDGRSKVGEEVAPIFLGTIVLCQAVIRQRTKEATRSYHKQLDWTIEHGLKHLLGYDHDPTGRHWHPTS